MYAVGCTDPHFAVMSCALENSLQVPEFMSVQYVSFQMPL